MNLVGIENTKSTNEDSSIVMRLLKILVPRIFVIAVLMPQLLFFSVKNAYIWSIYTKNSFIGGVEPRTLIKLQVIQQIGGIELI